MKSMKVFDYLSNGNTLTDISGMVALEAFFSSAIFIHHYPTIRTGCIPLKAMTFFFFLICLGYNFKRVNLSGGLQIGIL